MHGDAKSDDQDRSETEHHQQRNDIVKQSHRASSIKTHAGIHNEHPRVNIPVRLSDLLTLQVFELRTRPLMIADEYGKRKTSGMRDGQQSVVAMTLQFLQP